MRVRETFPDRVLDDADEVVLVDLSPEALQERLRAGKVYPGGQAERALLNFFTQDNLSALRELALREVAEDVEARRSPKRARPARASRRSPSASSLSSSRSRSPSASFDAPGARRNDWAATSTRSGCAGPDSSSRPRRQRSWRRCGGSPPSSASTSWRRRATISSRRSGAWRPSAGRRTSSSALPTSAAGSRSSAGRCCRGWSASCRGSTSASSPTARCATSGCA